MRYQSIEGVDVALSRVVLGTDRLRAGDPSSPGGARARAVALARLDRALELGINAFDTAAIYQGGESERALGLWMRDRGVRDRCVVITKGGHPDSRGRSRLSRAEIEVDLAGSRQRLGVEIVDLFLLHYDDPQLPVEPLLEVLDGLVARGWARACGVSNWSVERVRQADETARAAGLTQLAAVSAQWSLGEWKRQPWPGAESLGGARGAPARRYYLERGVAVLAWASLGMGYWGRLPRAQLFDTPENRGRRERAGTMAIERGASVSQIALAYVLSQPSRPCAIVGCRDPLRLEENARAAAIELTAEEIAWLDTGAREAKA